MLTILRSCLVLVCLSGCGTQVSVYEHVCVVDQTKWTTSDRYTSMLSNLEADRECIDNKQAETPPDV